ncbi:peroxiredoxin [Tissierella sp. MSJ-40]|uniref:Peroxiredoxin n=1 Tax=Tissierella simiarum TaxID=2841534 RepID=A0ABS6E4U0_9FIRM|nr:peroxiredoxin [Tissierella simiarum]MBU5437927.1 peroxiredoxin [Tissierella simiarum]
MNEYNCLKLGMKAPDFTAMSTFGPIRLSDFKGRWIVLFSHPGDFTPVCTTEFIAFAKENDSFIERNAQLLGLSIDSNPSHLAWVYNIYQNTGIQIPFPIISDRDMSISKLYGMIAPDVSTTETIRSVFIIDDKQIIRAILTYPLTNGRFIPEILRLLIALQTTDSEKVATPADWLPGQPVVIPPPNTYEELLNRIGGEEGYYCVDWYLCFKNI